MPPILWPIITSVVVTWLLRETEMVWPVFIWFWALIILMFAWPAGAGWFIVLTVVLGILAILGAFWEEALGVLLGLFMFTMFVLALLSVLAR